MTTSIFAPSSKPVVTKDTQTTTSAPPSPQKEGKGATRDEKKQKPSLVSNGPGTDWFSCCLTCGVLNCRFENGHSIIKDDDGQESEYDPLEPTTLERPDWISNKSGFDTIKHAITTVVAGIFSYEEEDGGFWSRNKYIGDACMEIKLKTWMRQKIDTDTVKLYWHPLRRAVKEAIRYKRYLVVSNMQSQYYGKQQPASQGLPISTKMVLNLSSADIYSQKFPTRVRGCEVVGEEENSKVRLHHFLQFRNSCDPQPPFKGSGQACLGCDLPSHCRCTLEDPMITLAWVILWFVPFVIGDKENFWGCLLANVPIERYISPSDVAFAVLVLEVHLMEWRYVVNYRLDTREDDPCYNDSKKGPGLLYEHGIAGRDAKQRFECLTTYFFRNFFNPSLPEAELNLKTLNQLIAHLFMGDAMQRYIDGQREMGNVSPFNTEELSDEILHRVFYYMHY